MLPSSIYPGGCYVDVCRGGILSGYDRIIHFSLSVSLSKASRASRQHKSLVMMMMVVFYVAARG